MICTCCHVYYTKASCFYTYILKVFIVRGTYVWAGCDSDVNMSDCDSDVNMCHVWWLDDVPRTVDRVYKVSLM